MPMYPNGMKNLRDQIRGAASNALALLGAANPAKVSSAYSFAPSTSGGKSPYSYALQAGALPAGLSLSSSTGAITGTPTGV